MRAGIVLLVVLHCGVWLHAQVPDAAFSIPATGCIQENIYVTNSSTGADRYVWDFCQGDLSLSPTAKVASTAGGSVLTGLDIVFDGTNWFGFVASRNTNSILRLDFGSDPTLTPVVTDLGTIGGMINQPIDVKIVQENNNWYGFVYGDPMITRIDFGTSLTNTTASANPISATVVVNTPGTTNAGFDMVRSGAQWIIVAAVSPSFNVIRLSTVTSIPAPGDIISGIANPFAGGMGDVVMRQAINGDYFAYGVVFSTGKLLRLSFGSDPFTTPVIDDISAQLPGGATPYGVDLGIDNGRYYLVIATLEGNLWRIDLGTNPASNPVAGTNLGPLTMLANTVKTKLIRNGTVWSAFLADFNTTQIYRVDFPQPAGCQADVITSAETEPVVRYIGSGNQFVTLTAFSGGKWDEAHRSISIGSGIAPDIAFVSQNICVGADVNFNSTNVSGNVVSYNWDFGDTQSSSAPDPAHQYGSTGLFDVALSVTANNGCNNRVTHPIEIYPVPSAAFTLPVASPICTNNDFVFVNNTSDVFDGQLTYQWLVNNVQVGTSRNLTHAFTSTGDKDIKLVTSIPGCSDEVIQALPGVQSGPVGAFTISGQCVAETVAFTNNSSGDIVDFEWDLGNGQTSVEQNPSLVYPTTGSYTVSLSLESGNGCVTVEEKNLVIYSHPQPAFTLDLPPFSCSGTPSQFHDATPPPPDSNLQSWTWTFGDGTSGNGKNPVNTYTIAGSYNVTLQVTTDKGCTASVEQAVTIAPSPTTQVAMGSACVSQPTTFLDEDASVDTWLWKINNTNYTIRNPVHVFISAGTFQVQLTKTGANDCVTSLTRQVTVPVVPDMNFDVTNPCEGQEITLDADVDSPGDPIAGYSWTLPGETKVGEQVTFVSASEGSVPVTLKVISASGCQYSSARNVAVFDTPVAHFTADPASGPPPLIVKFENQSQGSISHLWRFNDVSDATSDAFEPQHTFGELGEYVVELVASNEHGCSELFSRSVNVIVPRTELQLLSLELAEDQSTGRWRTLLQVKNESNYTITAFDAVLDLGIGTRLRERLTGDLLPGTTQTYVLANELVRSQRSGYLCVEIIVEGDEVIANNTRCQPLGDGATLFAPYPNPAKDVVNVQVVSAVAGVVEIVILNSLGAEVYRKQVAASVGLNVFTLDLEGFDTGIYAAIIRSGGTSMLSRFLVE